MKSRKLTLSAVMAAAAGLSALGCGSETTGGGGPSAEAKVTGKVTIKGKPAMRGRVTFEPPFVGGKLVPERATDVQKDGTYALTTPAGTNSVIVAGTGDPTVDGSYNKKTVEVKPGENTIDLDLPFQPE